MQRSSADLGGGVRTVYGEIADDDSRARIAMVAAQKRPHARPQFTRVERLQQIVVCPKVQAFDPIRHMIPCGQYQYGRLETAPAKALEDLESRNVRQTDIQYDQTAGFGFGQEQSGIPVLGAVGGLAGGFEKRNDSARQCRIVLNEQDSSHRYPHSALSRAHLPDVEISYRVVSIAAKNPH